MTGFEPGTSGVGSNRSVNCATPIGQFLFFSSNKLPKNDSPKLDSNSDLRWSKLKT